MCDDRFAAPAGEVPEGAERLAELDDEGLVLCAGRPAPPEPGGGAARPVYTLEDDGGAAVPTGRVFVVASEGVDIAERVAALGYVVESVPEYAPAAAWIVARDGSIATALAGLTRLVSLEGLESVEPQMLRVASRREGGPRA